MDAKPAFDGFLEAFRFIELLPFYLITDNPDVFYFIFLHFFLLYFLWELLNGAMQYSENFNDSMLNTSSNFQFKISRACCQILGFYLAK